MVTSCLTVSLYEGFGVGGQEQDGKFVSPTAKGIDNLLIRSEKSFFSQIHDESVAFCGKFPVNSKFNELGQKRHRHVVDTIKTGIFQRRQGDAFAGPGVSGNYDEFQWLIRSHAQRLEIFIAGLNHGIYFVGGLGFP